MSYSFQLLSNAGEVALSGHGRHGWTWANLFAEVWPEVHEPFQETPCLEDKTLFAWLQTNDPPYCLDSSVARPRGSA
jgi:hypothetical protein